MPKGRIRSGDDAKLENLWYSIGMTKLQKVISRFEELSTEQQDRLADFLNELTLSNDEEFSFSDAERASIKELLKTDTASYTFDEVFAPLLK